MHPTPFLRALCGACFLATAVFGVSSVSSAASSPSIDEVLAPLTSAYMRAVKPGDEAEHHRELFGTVFGRVQRSYARAIDLPALASVALKTIEPVAAQSGEPGEVFNEAMNAALAELDPYSRYLDARSQNRVESSMTGAFGGLGLQVDMVDGLVRIVSTVMGTPAARAGLRAGDLILRFDDQPVVGMALAEAISRMRGDPGTPIALTVRRSTGADEFTLSLVRETIRSQVVRWTMEGNVLVLRLSSFTTTSAAALEQAIKEATATAKPRGVILDMRGNGGGLLRQAVIIADTFLSQGEIVSLRGRTAERSWQADAAEQLAGAPMVVLMDARSASASELVAAALQENGRAVVMGQRSFGKGSVQSMYSLGKDNGALRLTTALYYGPTGRSVQRTGVAPDVELVTPAGTTREIRREADREHSLFGSDEPPAPKARVEQSRCSRPDASADPALACAVRFLNAGGIDSFVVALEPEESASAP